MSVYVKPPINQPPVAKGGLFSFDVFMNQCQLGFEIPVLAVENELHIRS